MKKIMLLSAIVIGIVLAARYLGEPHEGVGTVSAIDQAHHRIEVIHEGTLFGPAFLSMKMFFSVEDTSLLGMLMVGDRIDFEYVKIGDGDFMVTGLEVK